MPKTLNFLFDVVVWVVVPLIMLIILMMAKRTAKDPDFSREVKSIKAGFWGGVVLVAILVVYKVRDYLTIGFPDNPIFQGFDLLTTFLAAMAVVILFNSKNAVASEKTIGLTVLATTAASLYALISYLLIRDHNQLLLSATLGVAFGGLLHFAGSPKSLTDFIERFRSKAKTRG